MDSREPRKGKFVDRGIEHSKSVLAIIGALSDGVVGCEPLKGTVGIAKELVEWIEKVRTNKKDCASLARQTYEYMYTIVTAVGEQGQTVIPSKLQEELATVKGVLMEIRDGARELGAQSFLRALASRDRTAEKITGFKEKLTHSLERFKMSSLIELQGGVAEICIGVQGLQLQQSVLPHFSDMTISASLPAASLHLIGRDSLVAKGVAEMSTEAQNHLAILGTGGIGKTSLALAVLHSPAIKETFGNLRFFVPCDSITAAGPLVFAILKTLGVDASAAAGDPLANLEAQISGMKPLIIALDNFETPWTSPNQEVQISNVLQRLSAAPQVHMIVTMRGNIPPSHSSITWTSLLLDMLTLKEAIELFLRINPSLPASEQPDLQKLLKELGGLPLAVKLLAELWQTSTCSRLLAQWKKKKTALLRSISGTKDRLTNLDISISISLESPVIAAVPEAPELLYVLCHLPDGVLGGIEKLASMDLSLEDLDGAISALYATGLVTGDIGDSIKVPSPIQHYILHHPLATQHLSELYTYYIALINAHSSFAPGNPKFLSSRATLGPETGNIVSLIIAGFKPHTQVLGLVDAAMAFTDFQYWECPSMVVIETLMHNVASSSVTADLHYKKARLHQKLDQYNHATEAFSKARQIYIADGNTGGATACLKSLGDICSMQDNYTEGTTALQEAQTEFLAIKDRLGAAQCLQSLGDIYGVKLDYTEATTALQEAQTEFMAIGSRLGAAQCLQSLGYIYEEKSDYTEATTALQEAQTEFLAIGDGLGAAQCLMSLGDIHRMQSNYSEATTALQEAQTEFLVIGNHIGAAQCLKGLGDIYCMQSDHTKATTSLQEAQTEFLAIGNRLGAAQCLISLGDIYGMQSKFMEATTALQEAQTEFLAIGNRLGAAQCLMSLGDIYRVQCDFTEATTALQEAQAKFLTIGECLGVAQCLQALGDIHRKMANYTEAKAVLQESMTICHNIGDQYGLAWSHKYLALTYWAQQLHEQALGQMSTARDIFLQIESQEAQVTNCQDWIFYMQQSLGSNVEQGISEVAGV